jgi:hypothetical protein
MIGRTSSFLILIFFFFTLAPAYGQDNKSIELKKILRYIENQHKVRFNYLDNDVKDVKIIAPRAVLPLKAKLRYIKSRTGLSYKESGNNYIILFKEASNEQQTLCGYVVDEGNNPLEYATVTYNESITVLTGPDGYFEIPKPEKGYVTIEYTGFDKKTFNPDSFGADCKEILLNSEVHMLEEVVTERYLTTGISKKKDGSFIIKPKKFGILPGLIEPDVLSTMQQLPGINSVDETVSNINVRGGTHDQNLFMWNGIRLFQTGHFFGLISALNPNPAYNIKIFKNGTSAYYGESVSSAVDISSRSENIEGNTTTIGSNMINADFYTRLKASEKANFEIAARRSFTDIIDLPTYSKYSKRIFQNTVVTQLDNSEDVNYRGDKEFYFYDFTGQYHQKVGSRHDLYMNIIGIKNKLEFTEGSFTATNFSTLNQLTLGSTIAWRSAWNETDSSEISIYNSYYNLDAGNISIDDDSEIGQKNIIRDTGIRLSNSTKFSEQVNLLSGYQFNQTSIENTETADVPVLQTTKSVLRTHALFGEAEFNSEDGNIFIRGGIRGNYIEQFRMLYFEPRLQFNYTITNAWSLDILGEMKSQSASQIVELQNDFLGLENRRWVLANDRDIPVQRSKQLSGGLTFKDKGWLLSLEHFYKKVDGITTGGQSFQNQLEPLLITGSYTVQGTEILVQKQFKGFYAWLTYAWNINNYLFDDFSPYKFPSNFEISHTINSAAIYEFSNFKVALGARWFTGRPVTNPISNQTTNDFAGNPIILYSDPNSDNIDNFFQVNFSATYLWKLSDKARLQLGVSVLNLFNKKNIINRYYRINSETDAIEVVNTYSVERTPNALLRLTF